MASFQPSDSEESDDDFSSMLRDVLFVDPDRDDTFLVDLYCDDSIKQLDIESAAAPDLSSPSQSSSSRRVTFECTGVKAELGQTLMSTGLTVWRAAENLNQFLFAQPDRVRGKRVVELGAGLGVVSIMLEKMGGCAQILATDGCPDTVDLFRKNAKGAGCRADVLSSKELMWGEGQEEDKDLHSFHVILAADVIYERAAVVPLLKSMDALLCRNDPNAEIILSFARRNVPVHLFLEAAVDMGFDWTLAARQLDACPYVFDQNLYTVEGCGWVCIDQPAQPGEPIYCLRRRVDTEQS